MIGATLDDAQFAERAGVRVIRYSGGLQLREALAEAGVPVADTLREAVAGAAGDAEADGFTNLSAFASGRLPSRMILDHCWSTEAEESQWPFEGAEGHLAEFGGDVGVATARCWLTAQLPVATPSAPYLGAYVAR